MDKLDLKKTLAACYTAKKDVQFLEVPAITFVSYEGQGDPATSLQYREAMGVLYGMVYTIKFMSKENGRDFAVMPLEAQWWTDNPGDFRADNRDQWKWKAMIAVPDTVDAALFEAARSKLREKKNPQQPRAGFTRKAQNHHPPTRREGLKDGASPAGLLKAGLRLPAQP